MSTQLVVTVAYLPAMLAVAALTGKRFPVVTTVVAVIGIVFGIALLVEAGGGPSI